MFYVKYFDIVLPSFFIFCLLMYLRLFFRFSSVFVFVFVLVLVSVCVFVLVLVLVLVLVFVFMLVLVLVLVLVFEFVFWISHDATGQNCAVSNTADFSELPAKNELVQLVIKDFFTTN